LAQERRAFRSAPTSAAANIIDFFASWSMSAPVVCAPLVRTGNSHSAKESLSTPVMRPYLSTSVPVGKAKAGLRLYYAEGRF
jgi:hypothetical protein